jgi:hypothetical protein
LENHITFAVIMMQGKVSASLSSASLWKMASFSITRMYLALILNSSTNNYDEMQ